MFIYLYPAIPSDGGGYMTNTAKNLEGIIKRCDF